MDDHTFTIEGHEYRWYPESGEVANAMGIVVAVGANMFDAILATQHYIKWTTRPCLKCRDYGNQNCKPALCASYGIHMKKHLMVTGLKEAMNILYGKFGGQA